MEPPKTSKFLYHNYGEEKLVLKSQVSLEVQGYSLRYDDSAHFIAVGCSDGVRVLYSLEQRKIVSHHRSENLIGFTCLRWRPQVHSKNKVLLLSDSESVAEYLMPSNIKRWEVRQQKNGINCLDYNIDGKLFATAGTDRHIRVYDEPTKKHLATMMPAEENYRGHSNRIFSVKFIDDNTIISGGWDAVVHIWDIREQKSVKHIGGPHIAGDAIDFQDGKVLTGSQNIVNPLQVWDIGTCKLMQNLQWSGFKGETPRVFTAKFSHFDKGTVAAGCSGTNEFKLFKFNGTKFEPINKISNLKGGCYSMDFHPSKQELAFTDASGCLCVFEYNSK